MSESTPNEQTAPNKIETRINKLYGEKMAAQESANSFKVENDELRTQMLDLQEQVKGLQITEPDATPKPTVGEHVAEGFDVAKLQGMIETSVGNVLSKGKEQAQKQEELRQAHVNSWGSATEEMAELKDKQSDLYKTAQNIWERDPELKQSRNGPYKAAMMARGIVGGTSKSGSEINAAQQQQTINTNIGVDNIDAAIVELDKEIELHKEQLSRPTGGNVGSVWMKYKDLQAKKGELIRKQKGN